MKTLLLIIISEYCTIITNGRLIEKNTGKPVETQPTESYKPVRISRQAFYEDSFGGSREDITQEDLRPYVRKGRYSIRSKASYPKTKSSKNSTEIEFRTQKATEINVQTRSTQPLIKKPIPKFNEVDDDDFQGRVDRLPVKIADSGEHEDEDFNLGDYEFDVNHDEFVGRGMPLEPRIRIKETKTKKANTNSNPKTSLPPPAIKMQSKVVIPPQPPIIQKRNTVTKKSADKMKEDYYDDVVTTTKVPETETKRDLDDELNDDTDESSEFNRQLPTRVVRSPWLVELIAKKMGDKAVVVANDVINIMSPISQVFPEPKFDDQFMIDPMTGKVFLF